jgi:hypothetical protein
MLRFKKEVLIFVIVICGSLVLMQALMTRHLLSSPGFRGSQMYAHYALIADEMRRPVNVLWMAALFSYALFWVFRQGKGKVSDDARVIVFAMIVAGIFSALVSLWLWRK